jgi:hypothetical protein
MSDQVHNERTKLTANLLNTAASGLLITGGVAPVIAMIYGVAGPAQTPGWIVGLSSFACVTISVAIRVFARASLGRLR